MILTPDKWEAKHFPAMWDPRAGSYRNNSDHVVLRQDWNTGPRGTSLYWNLDALLGPGKSA